MYKSIEAVGKTEEDAIASALAQIGKERDEVSVELIERAKSGFFGFGASPAKVRVSYHFTESSLELTQRFLLGLLQKMGSSALPLIEPVDDTKLSVNLKGEKLGLLIGRRGETLDAIQHITNFVVNKNTDKRVHITIDAESYRSKREESLQHLAHKVAGKVLKYRKNMTLEPMNSYERHVIHTALQDFDGVSTFSTGTEPNRRIVIAFGKNKIDKPRRHP